MSNIPQFAFAATGTTASVSTSAGASTAATALPGGDCDSVYIVNTGAATIYVALGSSTVTATTSNFPVLANSAAVMATWGLQITHFAVYSATGSITVLAQRGRGGYSFNAGVLVSAASSASPIQVSSYTTLGSSSFVVPNNVNVIYVSGCGGGGGGGGGYSGTGGGGGGGGPAPCWKLVPLSVIPGSTLTTFVGSGGSSGGIGADGGDGTESYISGAGITSPFKNASDQFLMGYGLKGKQGLVGGGGDGGGAMMASTANGVYGTLNTGTGHASRVWYVADGFADGSLLFPICQGAGGGAISANGGSRGAGGFRFINGNGLGQSGTGNASGGGGGAGGGGAFGVGGDGGIEGGAAAGNITGYGSGGGGGAGGAIGTAGANGRIDIWY